MPSATPRTRVLGLAILALSVASLGVSLPVMARQIRAQNADADLPFFGIRSPDPASLPFVEGVARFNWGLSGGTAPVTLTLVDRDASPALRIDYRDESRLVPITGPVDARLPGLARFRDGQIKLEVISEQRPRLAASESDAPVKSAPDRLVLVARIERDIDPDKDPSSMAGVVDRKAWRYDITEFVPLGAASDRAMIVHEIGYAELPEHERTWQYAAALSVTPPTKLPKMKDPMGSNQGLAAVTWPLPVAGVGGLLFVLGTMVFAGSFVKTPGPAAGSGGASGGASGGDSGGASGGAVRKEKSPSRPANA